MLLLSLVCVESAFSDFWWRHEFWSCKAYRLVRWHYLTWHWILDISDLWLILLLLYYNIKVVLLVFICMKYVSLHRAGGGTEWLSWVGYLFPPPAGGTWDSPARVHQKSQHWGSCDRLFTTTYASSVAERGQKSYSTRHTNVSGNVFMVPSVFQKF